jgi:PPM family protein phosphatase
MRSGRISAAPNSRQLPERGFGRCTGVNVVSLIPSYSARTDAGRVRELNEDFVYAGAIDENNGAGARHLLIVADGVGGRDRGEWASERGVQVLATELPIQLASTEPREALRLAMQATNELLWREEDIRGGPSTRSAATTLVAVLIDDRHLWWANVGDSRAYLVDQTNVQRLSQDHSWVEEQVRMGSLTPEEARQSGRRNVITRGIGYLPEVEVDTGGPVELHPSDVIVLCSDGLHGVLNDNEIAEAVRSYPPTQATEHLVALSNQRGGPDNISVIVCGFQGGNAP